MGKLSLMLAAGVALFLPVNQTWADGELVTLTNLPPVVQNAIQTQVGKGRVGQIEKNVEDGQTTYDVEMRRNNRQRSFTVDDAGKLLETEVFLRELHGALHAAIEQEVGADKIDSITKVFDDDGISYEVDLISGPAHHTLTFDAEGHLKEREIATADAPRPVQDAFARALGLGELTGASVVFEDGETNYQFEIKTAGHSQVLTFAPGGSLVSVETELPVAETPGPVQSALAGLHILTVTKSVEDGETTYDVEYKTADGKSLSKTVDALGRAVTP